VLRTLVGVVLGALLATVGVDALISLNRSLGYFDQFGYEQAVLGLLLVLACVIAVQLGGMRPPGRGKE